MSTQKQSQDAESVLRLRTAVCQGYSELFLALCQAAHIPCVLVTGFSKGLEHQVGTSYTADTEINHAWNLVHIQGEWRPLDSTWGAGHLEKGGQFKREFGDHWFLTDPEDFLPTHFPYMDNDLVSSQNYQLVSRPMDLQTFSDLVKPQSPAVKIGLQTLTHKRTVIDVKNDVTVKVKVRPGRPPLESVTAYLTEPSSRMSKQDRSGVVTSLGDDGTCSVYVRPHHAGTYHLTIMGRTSEQPDDAVYEMVTYVINCTRPKPSTRPPFPDKSSGYWGWLQPMATECGVKKTKNPPFKFCVKKGSLILHVLLSKGTVIQQDLFHADNMHTNLKQYTLTEYTHDRAIVSVRLPRTGYYMLRIYASRDKGKQLPQVADLLLRCHRQTADCQPFPEAYTFTREHNTRLLQPLNTVKPGEKTLVRVYAPTLGKVRVDNTPMKLKHHVWQAEVSPSQSAREVAIFGAKDKDAVTLNGLYRLTVTS